jgi:hypothetical protein
MMRTWKGAPRPERVHEPEEARALLELRAAHPVVAVDVALGDGPAFPGGIGVGALELARDGLLLVGHVLVGGLPRVDRGDHDGCLPSALSCLAYKSASSGPTTFLKIAAYSESRSLMIASMLSVNVSLS